MNAEPADLLEAARAALGGRTLPGVTWPRATALLTRQALESAVRAHLSAAAPGVGDEASWASRMIVLRFYVDDPDVARSAYQAWGALSWACHHHAYDLAPTAAELRVWLVEVERVVAALGRRCGSGASAGG